MTALLPRQPVFNLLWCCLVLWRGSGLGGGMVEEVGGDQVEAMFDRVREEWEIFRVDLFHLL